ncbi:hypothetical protein M900_1411 [Bacteriovorax sp. Seq25_V]|nr:hypothetical protein M900_1411 [Bacteriovorax sp. Seq25_V]
MNDEDQIQYYEHLCDEIEHDRKMHIDVDDYENDFQWFWALKTLKKNYFHIYFSFFATIALSMAYLEINSSPDYFLLLYSMVLIIGSILLYSLTIIIYYAHLKHEKELLEYRHKLLMGLREQKS